MNIPKIIHQIWIGPKDPPKFMSDWEKMNPDYEYILWDDTKVKELLPIKNQYLYDKYDYETKNIWNGKANILRIEILEKYGGIYIDADCKPLRPLEGYLHNDDFFTCYLNEAARPGRLSNGIIGSTQNNDLLKTYINEISKITQINEPSYILTGPILFTKIYEENNFKIKVYPSYYFLPHFFKEEIDDYDGEFKPFSYHYWGTTKQIYDELSK